MMNLFDENGLEVVDGDFYWDCLLCDKDVMLMFLVKVKFIIGGDK